MGMGRGINFLRLGLGSTLAGVALSHVIPAMPYVVLTLAGDEVDVHFPPDRI